MLEFEHTAGSHSIKGAMASPVNIVAPAISGGTANGVLKTCSTGTWGGSAQAGMTFNYQWFVAGLSVGFGNTYTPVGGDVGKLCFCAVTASNGYNLVANSNSFTVT